MKNIATLLILLGFLSAYSQVGIGTTTPSSASMLDVASDDGSGNIRGFKPPVVTIAQRNLIPVAATDVGMLVFVDDSANGVQCLQFFDGSSWRCLGGTGSRTQIGSQDFETTPATPTIGFSDSGAGAFQTGQGGAPVSNLFVSGSRGYGVNAGTSEITFDPVDFSSYSQGIVEFKLASFSVSGAANGGADNADSVSVSISTDGGTSFSDEFILTGTSNALYDFSGLGVVEALADTDNNQTTHDLANGGGSPLTGLDAQSTVLIEGLPNITNLIFRITLLNNGANELWAIDDVVFYGE